MASYSLSRVVVGPVHERAVISGQQVAGQHGFVQLCFQNPVQHAYFQTGLVDADGFEIRLVIKATGGIVVIGGAFRCDVERHFEAASSLTQDLTVELCVSSRGLDDWGKLGSIQSAKCLH
jgi:hypothetical protein